MGFREGTVNWKDVIFYYKILKALLEVPPVVASPPVGLSTFLTLLPLTVNSVLQVGALVDSVAPGLCPDWEHWDPNEPVR
jgi:hypothetical protein